MADFDEQLWADASSHPYAVLGPPAADDAIRAFESGHGFILPASHREFLRRGNGGEVGRARVFGVGRPDALDLGGQVAEMRAELEGMASGPVLPFANDHGGSYFCYDLGRPGDAGEFAVLYWDHECEEEPSELPNLWSDYAADFPSFLRKVIS